MTRSERDGVRRVLYSTEKRGEPGETSPRRLYQRRKDEQGLKGSGWRQRWRVTSTGPGLGSMDSVQGQGSVLSGSKVAEEHTEAVGSASNASVTDTEGQRGGSCPGTANTVAKACEGPRPPPPQQEHQEPKHPCQETWLTEQRPSAPFRGMATEDARGQRSTGTGWTAEPFGRPDHGREFKRKGPRGSGALLLLGTGGTARAPEAWGPRPGDPPGGRRCSRLLGAAWTWSGPVWSGMVGLLVSGCLHSRSF